MDFQSQAGCGALRSTAADLLKYVAANIGLTPSSLTPFMEKTHLVRFQSVIPPVNVALAWGVALDPQGRKIVSHGGATYGYRAFAGFDKTRRRGVVVLSNSSSEGAGPDSIGMLLLESEWQSNRRPKATRVSNKVYDSYVGQYRLSPNFNLGILIMRLILRNAPKAFIWIPAGICLAVIFVFLWCVANWIVLGCAALFGGLLAALCVLLLSWVVCWRFQPAIGIRREGDRIFAQATILWRITLKLLPSIYGVNVKLPPGPAASLSPVTFELLPESDTCFFERMSGIPMTFCRDGHAKVTRLTAHIPGMELSFKKISNQPPKAPEPSKPRAFIKLDTKFYDAYVGQYEFAPGAAFPTGIKLTIWQRGDQLVGQALGRNGGGGEFDMYPESETDFFLKINGAQLAFIKNGKGEVTSVIHHIAGLPDCEGKKLKISSE
jgi:hypothetical protein